MYSLNIERVRLFNNCLVRTSFVADKQGVFRVPISFLYDYMILANCLKVCFVDALPRWLFATHTYTAHLTIMDVVKFWKAIVPDYTDEVLARGHRFEPNVKGGLGIAICVLNPRVSMVERAISASGQL